MYKRILRSTALLLCTLMAMGLSGCRVNISLGTSDYLTGEEYPDASKYQAGAFTYRAEEITAVEIYWRSGEVEIIESDSPELSVSESGGNLPENTAMHCFLDGSVLRIRFCASGARIRVNTADKHLHIEIPKGIGLSVHTTSAFVKADTLEQGDILIAALSGSTELGSVTADTVDLSSSSGAIHADSLSTRILKCSASSGSVVLGAVSAGELNCSTSSGSVSMGNVVSEALRITTSSGSVKLTPIETPDAAVCTSSGLVSVVLPRNGAEISYTSVSGRLLTSSAYEQKGDLYVFGSGESRITVETSSGNLEIQ